MLLRRAWRRPLGLGLVAVIVAAAAVADPKQAGKSGHSAVSVVSRASADATTVRKPAKVTRAPRLALLRRGLPSRRSAAKASRARGARASRRPAVRDTVPPTAPSGVHVLEVVPGQVTLAWSASMDNVGVHVYRLRRDGRITLTATSTTATDRLHGRELAMAALAMQPASTHTYSVTAVDAAGNESAPSGELAVVVPGGWPDAPTAQPTPYVRMWTEVNNPQEARAVNQLTGDALTRRIDELVSWYVHFHAEASNQFPMGDASKGTSPTTLASKLAARGVMVSQYRNGSYVSQANIGQLNAGEAADLERSAPLAIATWWPGRKSTSTGSTTSAAARLASHVGPTDTSVVVTSAAAHKPAGAPDTWPYVASRGAGANPGQVYSANTHDFVSWVRIDDEIMRVRAVSANGATVTLAVDRGYFGTGATAHATHTRVMSPVYIGSTTATTFDVGLAGSPNVDNPGKALRYGLKIWQPDAIGWIAGRIKTTFSNGGPTGYMQGYNTVWLDVTSCSTYNNADVVGEPVSPWDDQRADVMSSAQWSAYQLVKLAGLRSHFGGATGWPAVKFTANNLASQGAATTQCRNDLLAGGFDGGVLEHWLQNTSLWAAQMEQHIFLQAANLPAIYWAKFYELSGGFTVAQYKRFTYGSYLLGYRPTSDRPMFGGNFGLSQPDELFRWHWGAPETTPASVADLAVPGRPGLYKRTFSAGVILVNTTAAPIVVDLGGTYYNVLEKDATGAPRAVTSVTVPAKDAAFLHR
jgi:hypothetical protein